MNYRKKLFNDCEKKMSREMGVPGRKLGLVVVVVVDYLRLFPLAQAKPI